MKKQTAVPNSGVLTTAMDVKSKEYREFQLFLSQRAEARSEEQKVKMELLSLQIKIEDYLRMEAGSGEIITVGQFLRLYLERLGIKQTKLARYLGLKPSNFSKILSGSRKLNLELSLILGQIFELDPQLWMSIQLKNDYEALKHAKGAAYQNYCLGDLVEYRKNQD